ncbi:SUKH-4 family immunity protein [Kitasatospora sp. NPDC059577]|uniref:SUKH-4 family immunity protein n=1 Tax=Kitasatospora sp. NPDC059577 TaxID=3346873 RepID=UPI00369C224E
MDTGRGRGGAVEAVAGAGDEGGAAEAGEHVRAPEAGEHVRAPEGFGPRELPAGLTHGPSRERLAAGGLPRAFAHLNLEASWYEPLRTAATWYDGLRDEDAGGLVVLGEADYRGSSGHALADVLLDGASGEVYLACGDDSGGLRRDLLAGSLDTLVALMIEVEAVTAGAAEPYEPEEDEEFEPRGPGTVAEATRVSLDRMRAVDPELFRRTDDRPAHWETAVRIRALAWGALPGGPDDLRYALDASLVEELAALTGGTVRRFREDELPAVLGHAPTRRLLTGLGLPLSDRGTFRIDPEGPLLTMAQTLPDAFEPEDEEEDSRYYQAGFLALADWTYDFTVALDGATGRLELPPWFDDGEPAAYLHRDVSALLHVLWAYERLRADRRDALRRSAPVPWEAFDPCRLLDSAAQEALRALDPEAFASGTHFWPILADDGHMGGLLE